MFTSCSKKSDLIGCWQTHLSEIYEFKEDGSFIYYGNRGGIFHGTWKLDGNDLIYKYEDLGNGEMKTLTIEKISNESMHVKFNSLVGYTWIKQPCSIPDKPNSDTIQEEKSVSSSTNTEESYNISGEPIDSTIDYLASGNEKYSAGDFKGAIRDYSKMIVLDPEHWVAYDNRGLAKNELGDYQGAMADYTRSINAVSNSAAYIHRGISKYELKDYKGAITDYTKVIENEPGFSDAYHNRAMAYFGLGLKKEACLDFSKAAELGDKEAKDAINKLCK